MGHYDKEREAREEERREERNKCFRNFSPEQEKDYKVGVKPEFSWRPDSEAVNDAVSSPNHYLKLGYECIEIIACSLSKEAFKGYCMGNFLKYRFRMGDKDAMQQDFGKSKEYLILYERYQYLCRDIPF